MSFLIFVFAILFLFRLYFLWYSYSHQEIADREIINNKRVSSRSLNQLINEDPDDCIECDQHEGDYLIVQEGEAKYSYEVDNKADNESGEENNITLPEPTTNNSEVEPLPPDISYETEQWVQYYDPLRSKDGGMGMEIIFWIMRGYKRTDGEEKKNFFLKDDGPYPAGSMREYVFENDPTGMGDGGNSDLKDNLKELIEAYRAGDRL